MDTGNYRSLVNTIQVILRGASIERIQCGYDSFLMYSDAPIADCTAKNTRECPNGETVDSTQITIVVFLPLLRRLDGRRGIPVSARELRRGPFC